jgi:hypothetical protein
MTRYERKIYFERLLALRDAYRAEDHESTGMTIADAITYAELTYIAAAAADVADAAAIETALTKGAAKVD